MLTVVKGTLEHATALAPRLCEADKAEIRAATGNEDYELGLREGVLQRGRAWAVVDQDGTPFGMYGHTTLTDTIEWVWYLGADMSPRDSIQFARECLPYVEHIQEDFPVLLAMADSRNTRHHRWLKFAGFKDTGERHHLDDPEVEFMQWERTK